VKLERVLIIPNWERENRSEGWAIYGEEESGQITLIGTVDIGPFDTLTDVARRASALLVAAGAVMF
jgi:hypothetical protein